MSGRFAPLFCLLALAFLHADLARAVDPSASDAEQLVVLRNGEILRGHVLQQADRYVVTSPGAEIRVPARDVDFVSKSLDEAYSLLRNRVIAGRVEDHLNLADWCLRQNLVGYAARETAAAMDIDPQNPRVALFDRRLQRAQEQEQTKPTPPQDTAKTSPKPPISSDELERLVRCLPGNSVETFTATIQPMLLNNCATAGCHGPCPASKYTLMRPGIGEMPQRRLTQRNLYNTLTWVDHESPADSKLLAAAKNPHGAISTAGATGLSAMRYQELAAWVFQATQGVKVRTPSTTSAAMPVPESQRVSPLVIDSPMSAPAVFPEVASPIAAVKLAARQPKRLPAVAAAPPNGKGAKSAAPLPQAGGIDHINASAAADDHP